MRARNWEIGRLKSRQDELVAALVLRSGGGTGAILQLSWYTNLLRTTSKNRDCKARNTSATTVPGDQLARLEGAVSSRCASGHDSERWSKVAQ